MCKCPTIGDVFCSLMNCIGFCGSNYDKHEKCECRPKCQPVKECCYVKEECKPYKQEHCGSYNN